MMQTFPLCPTFPRIHSMGIKAPVLGTRRLTAVGLRAAHHWRHSQYPLKGRCSVVHPYTVMYEETIKRNEFEYSKLP